MTLTLRYMQISDIAPVVLIDTLSFTPAWSARTYTFEVADSNYSHMLVLEQTTRAPERAGALNRLLRRRGEPAGAAEIVGYAGLWVIADEGHISTIATHPLQRGRGFGRLLLAAMIAKAHSLAASYIVLEVRRSNTVAQALYHDTGFTLADTKKSYYQDGEDAYDMRLSLTDAHAPAVLARCTALLARPGLNDLYTTRTKEPPAGRPLP
jgi:ribosomal-protein-alanine N-acetyltransferase